MFYEDINLVLYKSWFLGDKMLVLNILKRYYIGG